MIICIWIFFSLFLLLFFRYRPHYQFGWTGSPDLANSVAMDALSVSIFIVLWTFYLGNWWSSFVISSRTKKTLNLGQIVIILFWPKILCNFFLDYLIVTHWQYNIFWGCFLSVNFSQFLQAFCQQTNFQINQWLSQNCLVWRNYDHLINYLIFRYLI